jgi:hypothetical protein
MLRPAIKLRENKTMMAVSTLFNFADLLDVAFFILHPFSLILLLVTCHQL